ncbi:MAG TPA: tetratricopeptide repeat protein, partial [Actinomycetota bacterium]|nr:tetratricopeptide repeat protein [Actinomycetota bacterium]
ALALDLALDARGGDAAAAEQARALIADAVADHPDNPGIRVLAADVEILLGDEDAARAWIDRHLERFPGDTVRIPPGRNDGETNVLEP